MVDILKSFIIFVFMERLDLDKLRLKLIDKLVSCELVICEMDKLDGDEKDKILVLFDVKKNMVVSHWLTGDLSNRMSAVDDFLNKILL